MRRPPIWYGWTAVVLIAGSIARSDEPIPPVAGDQYSDRQEAANSTSTASVPAPSPSPNPWKTLFFDNDFRDTQNPNHQPLFGEELKEQPVEFLDDLGFLEGSTLSYGGEFRFRYMNEDNRLRPGGPGRSTYDLWRWRQYLDFHASDLFRLYVEMLDASIFNEELPPTPIDLNRWNIQNAFVDVNIVERDGKPIYFRAGRQELLYGAQRLVSPLDWGNTRRNFEGFKLSSKGATWDLDVFTTRPVNTATGNLPLARFDNEADRADASRTFNGVYTVYHGLENNTFDFYWLWLREQEEVLALKDGSRHTVGIRWQTARSIKDACCNVSQIWKADLEGAYQFGHDNNLTVQAGFFTAELSVTLPQMAWQPTVKGLYYWGSGDRDAADDEDNTFSVLFPLGHAYWGLIDNLSGQNLNDYSVQVSVKPAEKLTLLAAMHWFDLDRDTDVLYNVAGVPLGTPGTGTEVGEELDLVATYVFNPNFNVQAGQFWFWNGTFIQNNLPRRPATQFYVQTTFRF